MDKSYRKQYIGKEAYYADVLIRYYLIDTPSWEYQNFDIKSSNLILLSNVVWSGVVRALYG